MRKLVTLMLLVFATALRVPVADDNRFYRISKNA